MNRTPRLRRALFGPIFALGAFFSVGCSAASESLNDIGHRQSNGTAVIRVVNHQYFDMTVYALRDGIPLKLGVVDAFQFRDFRLPASMLTGTGYLNFRADPLGSNVVHESQYVPVWPGRRVLWDIGNTRATSAISVF